MPQVTVHRANSPIVWHGKLKQHRSLAEWVAKLAPRLQLDTSPQQLRIAHVRDGGREVDIWDDYDFDAFKSRAAAQSTPLVVKVYPPGASSEPGTQSTSTIATTPARKPRKKTATSDDQPALGTPTSTKKDKGKSKTTPQSQDLPAPVLQPQQPSTPTAAPKPKKRKRDSTSSAAESFPTRATPGQSTSADRGPESTSPQQPKKKRKRGTRSDAALAPAPAQSPANSSTPAIAGPSQPFTFSFPLQGSAAFINRYKPAKPSPLGRIDDPLASASQTASISSPVAKEPLQPMSESGKKSRKPRKRKEKKDEGVGDVPASPAASSVAPSPAPSSSKKQKGRPSVTEEIMRKQREKMAAEEAKKQTENTEKTNGKGKRKEKAIERPAVTPAASIPTPVTPFKESTQPAAPELLSTQSPLAQTKKASSPKTPKVNRALEIMRLFREKQAAEAAAKAAAESVPPAVQAIQPEPPSAPSTQQPSAENLPCTPASPAPALEPKKSSSAKSKVAARPSVTLEIMRKQREKMAAAEAEAANNAEEENAGEAMDVDQPRENVHIQPVGQSPKQGQAAQTTSTNPQIEPKSVAPPPPSSHGFTAAPQTPSQTLAQSSQPSNSSSATKKSKSGRPSITSEIMRKQREAMAQQAEKEKEREEQPETRNDGNKEASQTTFTKPAQPQCLICHGSSHPQKDCPVVKAGVPRLQQVLLERKEEDESPEAAVAAIEMWIDRLGRVTSALMGTPATKGKGKQSSGLTAKAKQAPSSPAAIPPPGPAIETESSASESSKSPSPPPPKAPSPPVPTFPPIYHKALSRKAGSTSGLSVSDAVIETGSSASESSEDEDGSLESGSGSGSESESESESSVSDKGRNAMSRSRSTSISSSTSSSSPSPPPPDLSMLDPQAALRHFLTAPLSQKQRRAARDSAAHMQAVDTHDVEVEEASEVESDEDKMNTSFSRNRMDDEESLVGEFEDDEKEEDELEDVEEPGDEPPALSQVRQSDDEMQVDMEESQSMLEQQESELQPKSGQEEKETGIDVTETEAEPMDVDEQQQSPLEITQSPSASSQLSFHEGSRQSFNDLAALASPSAQHHELPGDAAVREAIAEDEALVRNAMRQDDDVLSKQGLPDGVQEPVVMQQLMSPPSSVADREDEIEPLPATQLVQRFDDDEGQGDATPIARSKAPVRRSTRQASRQPSVARDDIPSSQPSTSQLAPPPLSPPRRRLRSASRELAPASEPSRTRMTRSSSQQHIVPSSPQVPIRRSTRRTVSSQSNISQPSSSQVEPSSPVQLHATLAPATLRRSSRRQTTPLRSSQVDELDPSSPPPATQQPVEKSPLFIPEMQLQYSQSQSSQSQSLNPQRFWGVSGEEENPLFLSQGSQIPQTQAYNLYPNIDSSSDVGETPRGPKIGFEGSSPSNDKQGEGKRANLLSISSPILEEDEEEQNELADTEKHEQTSELGADEHDDKSVDASEVSSDDEESSLSIPISRSQPIYPSLPRSSVSFSQPVPAPQLSGFPTLSSLPREALRRMKSTFGFSTSQPENSKEKTSRHMNGAGDESESETSGDSSDEEPASLRGRFAGTRTRKMKNQGAVKGW
ncbi:uncharacterized protein IAS62_001209 [Cryptococcus decagattii]|uniref:Nucleolar protein Dnt1-like N-terminal domain-containing protein n=1 Tax=Cryptococcus decagattii TaxID=1859122 RepID=A0ABZ2APU2_9TREE